MSSSYNAVLDKSLNGIVTDKIHLIV